MASRKTIMGHSKQGEEGKHCSQERAESWKPYEVWVTQTACAWCIDILWSWWICMCNAHFQLGLRPHAANFGEICLTRGPLWHFFPRACFTPLYEVSKGMEEMWSEQRASMRPAMELCVCGIWGDFVEVIVKGHYKARIAILQFRLYSGGKKLESVGMSASNTIEAEILCMHLWYYREK